jgi:hypothetical protein
VLCEQVTIDLDTTDVEVYRRHLNDRNRAFLTASSVPHTWYGVWYGNS